MAGARHPALGDAGQLGGGAPGGVTVAGLGAVVVGGSDQLAAAAPAGLDRRDASAVAVNVPDPRGAGRPDVAGTDEGGRLFVADARRIVADDDLQARLIGITLFGGGTRDRAGCGRLEQVLGDGDVLAVGASAHDVEAGA